jgi:type 1 fimbria pilin
MNLDVDLGDSACGATVKAPAAASATIDETHVAGNDLAIDLSGESFDSVLVVVFDTSSGSVTYSNRPENIKEIYDFTHGGTGGLSMTVPGSALANQTIYAVGVAGLKNATEDDFDNTNTLISSYMAGKMKFYPVSTL